MASFLLSECLENIFSYLLKNPSADITDYTSTKDLRSCTLVSRHWCRVSTPFLYAYPFHHFRHLAYPNESYYKLIRTLLSCVPKSEIELIYLSNFSNIQKFYYNLHSNKSKSLDIQTTFNYATFIRGIIFNEKLSEPLLYYYRKIWLPPYIPINDGVKNDRFSKISISIMNYLVEFLCKHCNNLKTIEFPYTVQNKECFKNIIELLTTTGCKRTSNKLIDLEELFYIDRSNEIMLSTKDFYSTLSHNICNLNLLYNEGVNSIDKARSLSQFISLQKGLRSVTLSENKHCSQFFNIEHYNPVFESLSTQLKSLESLEFKYLSFVGISERALNSLCRLGNIKELKLFNCRKVDDNLNPWAKYLSKLESLEFVAYYYTSISEDFLIQTIKSSSSTLNRLVIKFERSNDNQSVFKEISLYSTLLTHLDLPKIYPDELIAILKSCTKLNFLCAELSNEILWDDDFEKLGDVIPKGLQMIQFKKINHFMFSSYALRALFKSCANMDGKLKYLKISGKFLFDQKYFDVANEFGINLINKRKKY